MAHESGPLGIRELWQTLFNCPDPGRIKHKGQQVWIGKIAIILGFLFRAHGPRFALSGVEQPGLLDDLAAIFDYGDLPPRLILDRLLDITIRIDVLDLAACAQGRARPTDRDIHVGAQIALFHVAIAGPQIAKDPPKLFHIGRRFFGGAHVGIGDDLHQGGSRAVEIDQGGVGVQVMDRFAGVLL